MKKFIEIEREMLMTGGRRKSDTLQYKAVVSLIGALAGIIISIASFFLGQVANAKEEGFKDGVQNSKIVSNTEQVKVLHGKINVVKKDQEVIKDQIHKVDKTVTEVSSKIDLLINGYRKRAREE